ncbi:MAG: FAD-dependent oxidoreductase [Burkholderiales bacterium]|nr:FAD-dependent oxidoreductase [Burkholderiales bacterium]
MRVAVIGAGIVGVTTAYELALQGHAVTVLERRDSVAAEGSFAPGGIVAPAWVAPWAMPGLPARLLRALLGRSGGLRLGPGAALAQAPWLWRAWRASRPGPQDAHRLAMWRLAQFSRERLLELTRRLELDYEQEPGCLVLLRSGRDLDAARPALRLMREQGVAHELIDASRCRQLEPAMAPASPLHAAVHLPQDGVGNCRQFAHLLKAEAQKRGVQFRFQATVQAVQAGRPAQVRLVDGQTQAYEAVVVCAGAGAGALLRGVGLRLPLLAWQGSSVTAPVRHFDGQLPQVPRAALIDARYGVTLARLGDRIRVAGTATLGGASGPPSPQALRTLYAVLDDWYPSAARTQAAQHWQGASPTLPDGPPALGASGAEGVWVNAGHGEHGWALACGSACVLAEQISGRAAPLDLAGLTAERWR